MPNNGKIDQVVDPVSYEQLSKLQKLLKDTKADFIDTANGINQFNAAISGAKSITEFNKAALQSETALQNLKKKTDEAAASALKLDAAKQKISDDTAKRLIKEQQIENAKTKTVVSNSALEVAAYNKSSEGSKKLGTALSAQEKEAAKASSAATALVSANQALANSTIKASSAQGDLKRQLTDADKIVIKSSGSLSDNIKQQIELGLQLKTLNDKQAELKKSFVAGITTQDEYISKSSELAKQQAELKKAVSENALAVSQATKIEAAASSSYNEKSAKLDQLRTVYKSLNEEELKNAQVGGVVLENIKKLDEELKKTDSALGTHTREVGNYGKALEALPGEFKEIVEGIGHFGKALLTNPIGLIISGLVFLYEILKSNNEVFLIITGIFKGFETVVKNVGSAIGSFLIPIIESVVEFFKSASESASGVLDVLKNIVQFIPAFKLVSEIIGLVYETMAETIAESIKYEQAMHKIEEANNRLNVAVAESALLIQRQATIVRDATKSIKERLSALDEQSRLELNITDKKVALIEKEITVESKHRNNFDKNSRERIESENKILVLETKRFEALRSQEELETTIARRRSSLLIKEENERKKAAADEKKRLQDLANDAYSLDKQRLEQQRDSFKQTEVNTDQSLSVRLVSQQAAASRELALLDLTKNKELSEEGISADKRKAINEKYANDLLLLQKQTATERLGIISNELDQEATIVTEAIQKQFDENQKANKKRLNEIETARDNEIAALYSGDENYQEKRASIQAYYLKQYLQQEIQATQEVIDLNLKAAGIIETEEAQLAEYKRQLTQAGTSDEKAAIQSSIDKIDQKLQKEKAALKDVSDLEKQLAALRANLSSQGVKQDGADQAKRIENTRKAITITQEISQAAFGALQTFSNNYYQSQVDKINATQQASNDTYDREKKSIESSTLSQEKKAAALAILDQKKAASDKKAADDIKRASIEKAKRDRDIQIGQIIAQTAIAVITQLASGPVVGFALAAAAAAVGAIQLAAVLATPLPAFEHGGEKVGDGPARFSEKGPELRIEPDGKISMTPERETIGHVKHGTKFISNNEVKSLMAKNSISRYSEFLSANIDLTEVTRNADKNASMIAGAVRSRAHADLIHSEGSTRTYRTSL